MYIGDLHIHSGYSRATSKDCTPVYLDIWARKKGIHIIGTGDFTHPAWREELMEKLEPDQDGLYVLKEEYRIHDGIAPDDFIPRFAVTGEISSIYKKNDKVRKVHSLILLPDLEAAQTISQKLEAIGNIHSDGRPILGIDCRDMLEIILTLCPRAMYVPAHIWTPHFSMFGAFSGFDTVEECFEDLASEIHAVETGLSSDPPMNWRVSALDKYQLISNSDAHSPAKLGREANLFDMELSYDGLYKAIQTGDGLYGTIEFFPEEGKYHFDGHRKCHVCLSPSESQKYGGKCPVCGRKLTIGVSHRVEQLADQPEGRIAPNARPFESLVPLLEVIGAATGHASSSVKVARKYEEMIRTLGPEFEILRNVPVEDIGRSFGNLIASGIQRLRQGKVERLPGFDGEYGKIRLFSHEELNNVDGQMSFFYTLGGAGSAGAASQQSQVPNIEKPTQEGSDAETAAEKAVPDIGADADKDTGADMGGALAAADTGRAAAGENGLAPGLNPQQQEAVTSLDRCVAVVAGPGTGKTRTLIARLAYMLSVRRIKPGQITAVTFTNKAAGELKARLAADPAVKSKARRLHVGTFHALCLELLKKRGQAFTLADSWETLDLAADVVKEYGLDLSAGAFLQQVSLAKSVWPKDGEVSGSDENAHDRKTLSAAIQTYNSRLHQQGALDFDDLILEVLKISDEVWPEFDYLLVDEFQDINPVQYALIKHWNQQGKELFVIGDGDQSIYGFRGSDSRCFLKLDKDFPGTRMLRLTQNYRSSPQILECALSVIHHNPGEKRLLEAFLPNGEPVRVVRGQSERAMAIYIAHEINRYIGGIDMLDAQENAWQARDTQARSFSDIAILYRTHRQAKLLEECLQSEGIPYVVAGRDDFLTEKSVRGSLAFFDWMLNPQDEMAAGTCLKLLWDYENNAMSREILESYRAQFDQAFKKKPDKFIETWIKAMDFSQDAAMEKLAHMTGFYKTMAEFMDAVHLGIESDLTRCGSKNYDAQAVTLMTLHGAKGLEFPVVMLSGVEKGMLPYESEKHPANTEEERRLFFVGITRAKEELVITWFGESSDFLEELPDTVLRQEASRARQTHSGRQMNLFDFM